MKSIKKLLKKLFRNISYKIFFNIYGQIKLKKSKNKKVSEKKIKIDSKLKYSIYESINSRLYTNRIQDTAVIQNNIILEKQSFQLRNNNFDSNIKKNIVLKIGTPRLMNRLNGNVVSLLTGGGGNNNYFHWLFDVLPKLGIIEKSYNLKKVDYFLCPNLNSWQQRTLNLLGISDEQCLSSVKFRHIHANKIITTDHPWLKSKNVIRDMENIPNWVCKWLKNKFLSKKSKKKFPKKIFIDRSDTNSNYRYIVNEKEVSDFLHTKGFTSIKLANLSFEDEIKIFNGAKIVVGLQGAGLTNLIWSGNNTKIIELRSKYANKLYENLAKQNNLKFDKIITKPLENISSNQSINGTLKINIKKLSEII